jgi:hypothetical protein
LSQPFSGKFLERRAPGGAGVVDQDVERRLAPRDLGGERARAFDGRDVGRQRHAGAAAHRRELVGGALAGLGLARRDVDGARALREEAGGDHAADASRAAGDERHAPVEREESGGVHGVRAAPGGVRLEGASC